MIVARHVTGAIGRMRGYVRAVLLIIYVAVPWITWGGRPAVLMDITNRKFYFPGIVIWPQEFYYLLLLLLILGLSLFLFTSLFGRLWCGWACPQTVYTELFDAVGRFLLPSRFGKRSEKIYHKILIHSIWIILSAILTFHFIAYFVPAMTLIDQTIELGMGVFQGQIWPYFFLVTAAMFYFDLGLFREQFCVYLCPYARFQSVMLDRDSIVIAYDSHRGEPRRQIRKNQISATSNEGQDREGDCTSCNMCVLTCPTGIDIREGLQVACINCGHCVDACHHEMAKFEKKTLVGFSSLNFFEDRKKTHFMRPRTYIYTALISSMLVLFVVMLSLRVPIQITVFQDRQIRPFRDASFVQNAYDFTIGNLKESDVTYIIEANFLDKNNNKIESLELLTGSNEIHVPANNVHKERIMIRAKLISPDEAEGNVRIEFIVRDKNDPENRKSRESKIWIPEKNQNEEVKAEQNPS